MQVKKMSAIAMMTCLIITCSWLTIPAVVPFTMQTFAVFCTLLLLGGKAGFISLALYVLLGCVGIPVFSGFHGGIGHIVGPTGGYIIGFLFLAALYWLFEPLFVKCYKLRLSVLALGLMLCYLVGTIWFKAVLGMRGTPYPFRAAVSLCVLPYVVPDLAKLVLAYFVTGKIRKILR